MKYNIKTTEHKSEYRSKVLMFRLRELHQDLGFIESLIGESNINFLLWEKTKKLVKKKIEILKRLV